MSGFKNTCIFQTSIFSHTLMTCLLLRFQVKDCHSQIKIFNGEVLKDTVILIPILKIRIKLYFKYFFNK
jgi:hypothetical protein